MHSPDLRRRIGKSSPRLVLNLHLEHVRSAKAAKGKVAELDV